MWPMKFKSAQQLYRRLYIKQLNKAVGTDPQINYGFEMEPIYFF